MKTNSIAGFFINGWDAFDNFVAFQVTWRGKLYPTAEHSYQAAHFFETSPETAELVRQQPSARLAPDVANKYSELDDSSWTEKKVSVMEEIVRAKFEQYKFVQETLRRSGNLEIVEMNDADAFWGWGADHEGRNELGKIWMKLRKEKFCL